MPCGIQKFDAKVEIELGFAGRWSREDVLEALQNAIKDMDGICIVDAVETEVIERPCGDE
ncbi:Uncharacterised protein [uncultured archaeon]|nr:Uncharacterised protein [uncultured archaeon]